MTQLVAPDQKIRTVRNLLDRSKGQIALALPRHMNADRMLRVAMTCIQKNPALLECTELSLIGAIIQASQLGLEPDGLMGRAYIIPRRNNRRGVVEAHFQAGYQGLMDLARRSQEVAAFDARVVYQGDDFDFRYGTDPTLVHVPKGEEDEAKITHVYAVARMRNGPPQFEVMTRSQIEAHRKKYSRAGGGEDSAWVTSWPAMAKKTVIIPLCKYLPASVELANAVALVERDESGLPQDLGTLAGETLPAPDGVPGTALDALAVRLSDPPPAPALDPPPAPDAPPPPAPESAAMESERMLAINKALALRTTLHVDDKQWDYLTKHHLGGVAISRADPAALADLIGSLQKLADERAAKKSGR